MHRPSSSLGRRLRVRRRYSTLYVSVRTLDTEKVGQAQAQGPHVLSALSSDIGNNMDQCDESASSYIPLKTNLCKTSSPMALKHDSRLGGSLGLTQPSFPSAPSSPFTFRPISCQSSITGNKNPWQVSRILKLLFGQIPINIYIYILAGLQRRTDRVMAGVL